MCTGLHGHSQLLNFIVYGPDPNKEVPWLAQVLDPSPDNHGQEMEGRLHSHGSYDSNQGAGSNVLRQEGKDKTSQNVGRSISQSWSLRTPKPCSSMNTGTKSKRNTRRNDICVKAYRCLNFEWGRMPLTDRGALRWLVLVEGVIWFYDLLLWNWLDDREEGIKYFTDSLL